MAELTFEDFLPPPRYDAIPWQDVQIEEATTSAGPWTVIDLITLSPVDPDPADPLVRNFSTVNATAIPLLWYRVSYFDANGDFTLPTDPIRNTGAAGVSADGGPCTPWATADDIVDCCSDISTDVDLDSAGAQASLLLYEMSGYRFSGMCGATVRPCAGPTSCWQPLAEDWVASRCSCRRTSRVRLAGYPVRLISEVTIDGVVVDPDEYRLDYQRDLIRLADADGNSQSWPACQRMDLSSGEGTFFVSYVYGVDPPAVAVSAAAELGCAIAKACPNSGVTGDCELPAGTVRVARQGITIDTQALGLWLLGSLRTGMPLVDAFLSVYGGKPRRRTALMTPEQDPWPVRVS